MRYFLDTEFIENGPDKPIQLISIGIISEDNRRYYAISRQFSAHYANSWIRENVLVNLESPSVCQRKMLYEIAKEIIEFIGSEKPEFWGYYSDYDWVVFCQIFGAMIDLPKGWPMYCRDLKLWCDMLGNPRLPEQKSQEHNALNDALWNKQCYDFLVNYSSRQVSEKVG